jgi:hypothetical protein
MKKLFQHFEANRNLPRLCCLLFFLFAGFAQAQTVASLATSPNQPSVAIESA